MKDVNDFVDKYYLSQGHETLKTLITKYNEINKNIEALKQKKKQYDDLIRSNEKNHSSDLTFKEKYVIYTMIKNTIVNDKEQANFDIDLYRLQSKFEDLYYDLQEYLSLTERIHTLEESRNNIVNEHITFNCFNQEHQSEHCLESHSFVVDDNELKCVYCGATTKDYPLSKKEVKFLVLCAKQQKRLLEDFTKKDWPMLQVIIKQQDYRRSLRPEIDISAEDYLDRVEEQFYDDEYEFTELKIALAKAHMLDAQIYEGQKVKVKNPKYLSDKEKEELLENLNKELTEIKKTDSRFKSLLIEQCETAKFEILILSGEPIPTLLKKTINEDEKIALTKAYYNLSNSYFNTNNDYFDSSDSVSYDCYTANPEINNKILEMKLRRK